MLTVHEGYVLSDVVAALPRPLHEYTHVEVKMYGDVYYVWVRNKAHALGTAVEIAGEFRIFGRDLSQQLAQDLRDLIMVAKRLKG